MSKSKKKTKKLSSAKLFIIKNKTLQLRSSGSMPFYLTCLINALKSTDSVDYVQALCNLTEQLLRVKGYYKKYPKEEESAKQFCISYLTSLGF